eukprot:Opistho-2@64039
MTRQSGTKTMAPVVDTATHAHSHTTPEEDAILADLVFGNYCNFGDLASMTESSPDSTPGSMSPAASFADFSQMGHEWDATNGGGVFLGDDLLQSLSPNCNVSAEVTAALASQQAAATAALHAAMGLAGNALALNGLGQSINSKRDIKREPHSPPVGVVPNQSPSPPPVIGGMHQIPGLSWPAPMQMGGGLPGNLGAFSMGFSGARVSDKMPISRLPTAAGKAVRIVTKQEKKVAHNAIERRYRNSINDRILELRDIVPTCGDSSSSSKLNKATILRKAIDYIAFLQGSSQRAKDENIVLKATIQNAGLEMPDIVARNFQQQSQQEAKQRASADDAMDEDDDASDDSAESHNTAAVPATHNRAGLGDGSRMVMFALVFVFAFLSPLDLGTLGQSAAVKTSSRTLSSAEVEDLSAAILAPYVFVTSIAWWIVKATFALICLAVALSSEPIVAAGSQRMKTASELHKRAASALSVGDAAHATDLLVRACDALGRPVPSSSAGIALSLTWQCVRQAMHRLWIGSVIDSLVSGRSQDARSSFAMSAVVLDALHQAMPLNESSSRRVWAAVCAVNVAEASGDSISAGFLAEVYFALAATVRLALSGRVGAAVSRKYLSLSREVRHESSSMDASMSWLYHPDGSRFFLSGAWTSGVLQESKRDRSLSIVALVGRLYRSSLAESSVAALIGQGGAGTALDLARRAGRYSADCGDLVSSWWASTLSACAIFRSGSRTADAVREVRAAEALGVASDTTRDALNAAVLSRVALVAGDPFVAAATCDNASRLIKEDIMASASEEAPGSFGGAVRVLSLTMLLQSRTDLWRRLLVSARRVAANADAGRRGVVSSSAASSSASVGKYKQLAMRVSAAVDEDLAMLRQVATCQSDAVPKVHLFHAIARSLRDGTATRTAHLFAKATLAARKRSCAYDEGLSLMYSAELAGIAGHSAQPMGRVASPAGGSGLGSPEDAVQSLTQARALFQSVGALGEAARCNSLLRVGSHVKRDE